MGVLDQAQVMHAESARRAANSTEVAHLRFWLFLKQGSARIIAFNMLCYVPLLLGRTNTAGILLGLGSLLLLIKAQPTQYNANNPNIFRIQQVVATATIGKWRWILTGLVLFFFALRPLEDNLSEPFVAWNMYQGIALTGISALAYLKLQFGKKTSSMRVALKELEV